MTLEVLKDQKIIDRIEAERRKSEIGVFIDLLMQRFAGLHFQELGGTVRDIIISEWYGAPFTLRDLDLIVDDSEQNVDLFKLCRGLPGKISANHFGNVKWEVNGYEFDVTKYSSRRNKQGDVSLEEFFKGSDFNIGTIAYCMQHGQIVSFKGLEGIRQRTISLMNPEEDRPYATLFRAVDFEKRLGFRLDEKTLEYIHRVYTPTINQAILNYVTTKGMPLDSYTPNIERLREIAKI